MESSASSVPVVHFGAFDVDLRSRELRKRGVKIKLQDQPFRVLAMLLEHAGDMVAREDLRQKLWPADTFVDFDHGLNNAINRLREALCDSAEKPLFIETLPRRGYRFIAPISVGLPTELSARDTSKGLYACESTQTRAEPVARPSQHGSQVNSVVTDSGPAPARTSRKLLLTGALVAVIGIGWLAWYRSGTRENPVSPQIRSLAVLPLQNLSSNKEQEYFVEGMTDQLITDLAKISSLRVISRTSIMRYQDSRNALAQIARELNVDAVIEGTVLRSGDRVRITAQLIRAAPEQHLWSESYERNLGDVLTLQDDVARAIAHEVRAKLTHEEEALLEVKRPVNRKAYELYLKGSHFQNQRTEAGLKKGRDYFQQAVDTDPGYALAYAGLANSYDVLGGFSLLPARDVFPKAKAAAAKALALDSSLAEAHAALGLAMLFYDWNWAAAQKELKQSIKLNPNNATAHKEYALYFDTQGQGKEAIGEMERAHELDPVSLDINAQLGVVYRDGRHYDRAIEQCRKTVELDQNFSPGHWCLGMAYASKKMYKEATDELLRARATGGCPCELAALAYTYAAAGQTMSARSVLQELEKRSEQGYPLSYLISEVYAELGENDRAFAWLERAHKERDCQLTWLKLDPMIDSLRPDPRFKDLVRRVGLPE
jgi:TolB-like protein/DNA-binding winged helix-turn-helix (wHTH) protein/Tfp pilus assembly protein PilF